MITLLIECDGPMKGVWILDTNDVRHFFEHAFSCLFVLRLQVAVGNVLVDFLLDDMNGHIASGERLQAVIDVHFAIVQGTRFPLSSCV